MKGTLMLCDQGERSADIRMSIFFAPPGREVTQ
jgi:hypothetical protein